MVMPSSPHARLELIRCSANDSSGRVAGRGEKAPLHTRGGRGGRRSPESRSASASATPGPTDAKWRFSLHSACSPTPDISLGVAEHPNVQLSTHNVVKDVDQILYEIYIQKVFDGTLSILSPLSIANQFRKVTALLRHILAFHVNQEVCYNF